MCYVIITSKGFQCGASTGQMDADGALAQMAVRPAAGSTNARKYCRYKNQLQCLYRQYVEATQQNLQAMGSDGFGSGSGQKILTRPGPGLSPDSDKSGPGFPPQSGTGHPEIFVW
ncbi:hypothetical protein BT96DRAFT_998856 [Gymnopus androsaceus JB14]|uniref:Uncharacterized protein n=1 Tax=Gymnopus androsaceus JB14 TaxID=1447944 RepID=A0A6A4H9Y3_9AGAR|nr:hypothetical protein BT96DRAFT_998856 [Gymnopus androsaceus JB14]